MCELTDGPEGSTPPLRAASAATRHHRFPPENPSHFTAAAETAAAAAATLCRCSARELTGGNRRRRKRPHLGQSTSQPRAMRVSRDPCWIRTRESGTRQNFLFWNFHILIMFPLGTRIKVRNI